MKKTLATLLASFVAVALFTSGAFAESKGDKRKSEKQEISSGRQNSVKSTSDETENQAKEEQKELKEAMAELSF